MAECIETQLMPMKAQGQIVTLVPGHFTPGPSFMAQFASQSVNVRQAFSLNVLSSSFSWPPFRQQLLYRNGKTGYKISMKLHTCTWVGGGGLIENLLTFKDDLDLSRSQPCKITSWAISRFLLDKFPPNFNTE